MTRHHVAVLALAPTVRVLLELAGWDVVAGATPVGARDGVVLAVQPDGSEEHARAATAALLGWRVLAEVPAAFSASALVADLGSLGGVTVWDPEAPDPPVAGRLEPDQVRLLWALSSGEAMADAAAGLHLSTRSAERRLRDARDRLRVGAATTAVVELCSAVAELR